jgi:transposase
MQPFAAMDVASGVTISNCYRRHRHQEFLRFLSEVDANLPRGVEIHLVMDNYGTHKVSKVRTWLARHPRYHVHFTPTSGSWLNLVERLFAEVTERCVRRGSHTAVRQLEEAMLAYLDQRNRNPKPFVWKADADLILGKVERLCQRISNSGQCCRSSENVVF